jgi:hypothetical protein
LSCEGHPALFYFCIARASKAQIEIAATGWDWSVRTEESYDRKRASSNPATNNYRIF